MFKPVRMDLIEIIILKENVNSLLDLLYSFGDIEVEKNLLETLPVNQDTKYQDLVQKCEFLISRLELIYEHLLHEKNIKSLIGRFNLSSIADAEAFLEKYDFKITALQTKKNEFVANLYRIDKTLKEYKIIKKLNLDWNFFNESSLIYKSSGTIKTKKLKKINKELNDLCVLNTTKIDKNQNAIAFVSLPENREKLMNILQNNFYSEYKFDYAHDISKLENQNNFHKNELIKTEQLLKTYYTKVNEIEELLNNLRETKRVCTEIITLKSHSDEVSYICCWIPANKTKKLIKDINSLTSGICKLRSTSAEKLIKAGEYTYDSVPAPVKRLPILEPFRIITNTYGQHSYLHVDPTLISAITFLIMFGLMFGDIGHGIVLLVIASILNIFSKNKSIHNISVLTAGAGFAATICGILFGSFFGNENLINPLWFSPSQNQNFLLSAGIYLGMGMITIGILLNILQNIWQKNIYQIFFAQWGVMALVFYWILFFVIYNSYTGNNLSYSIIFIAAILATPLLLITLADILFKVITGKGEFAEIVFKPLEISLGLLTNTISFVRVAAFNMTHVALMMAVYQIAYMTSANPTTQITTIIEGNFFVILLEGLIVTIQALRLQYYEFYSKFFNPNGRPYHPLRNKEIQ